MRVVLVGHVVRDLRVAGFVGSELQALQALGCNWQPGACGIQAAQVVGWESFRLQEIQVLGPGLFKLQIADSSLHLVVCRSHTLQAAQVAGFRRPRTFRLLVPLVPYDASA